MGKRSLLIDLKVGESLYIDGERIVLTLEQKSGQRAKLRFVHEDASIDRSAPVEPPAPVLKAAPAPPERRQRPRGADMAKLGTRIAA